MKRPSEILSGLRPETGSKFPCRFDRRTRRITPAVVAVIAGGFILLQHLSNGGYVSAWFLAFAIAILGLYILSIPRHLKVTERAVEIICVLETTEVEIPDIASVRRLEDRRRIVPLLGSYGFFGYYGYYFDLKSWESVKVYAGNWSDAVEIVDIFEQRYIVSTPEAEKFIAAVEEAMENYRSESEKM